jgi:hypothetical protein
MDNSKVKVAADRLRRTALISDAKPCSLIAPKEAQIAGRVSSTAPMISENGCSREMAGPELDAFYGFGLAGPEVRQTPLLMQPAIRHRSCDPSLAFAHLVGSTAQPERNSDGWRRSPAVCTISHTASHINHGVG